MGGHTSNVALERVGECDEVLRGWGSCKFTRLSSGSDPVRGPSQMPDTIRGKRLTDGREEGRHPLSVSSTVTNRRRGGYFGLLALGSFVSPSSPTKKPSATTPFFLTGEKVDRPDSQVGGRGRGYNQSADSSIRCSLYRAGRSRPNHRGWLRRVDAQEWGIHLNEGVR